MPLIRPLDGYPDSFGSHRASVFPHKGPTSYQQMQPGSPVAIPVDDGDTVEAVSAGLKYFEYVSAGLTDDGLYEVVAVPLSNSLYNPGAPQTTYGLVWYTVNTRTQVAYNVDLSGSTVRLFALGPK